MKESKGLYWDENNYVEETDNSLEIGVSNECTISIICDGEDFIDIDRMKYSMNIIKAAPQMLERLQTIITEFENDSLSPTLQDAILDTKDFLNREII